MASEDRPPEQSPGPPSDCHGVLPGKGLYKMRKTRTTFTSVIALGVIVLVQPVQRTGTGQWN